MTRLLVLDHEAVQALADPAHRKHRQVVSHVQVVASRKQRAIAMQMVVPTAVRVEACWDRTSSRWAFPNHLRILDIPLDPVYANTAAAIRDQAAIPVADAHLGAAVQSAATDQITVITSDPGDMRRAAGDKTITLVAI